MNDINFSQWVTDTIGITSIVVVSICAIALVIFIGIWYMTVGKKRVELKNKKTKLEIKKMELDIENYEVKKTFLKAQEQRMLEKSNK